MTNAELKDCVLRMYKKRTEIPKPKGGVVRITKIGMTTIDGNCREGFQYYNNGYKKYVPFETLFLCKDKLLTDRELSRTWFSQNFPTEYAGRPCNFTTIGGIFVALGLAQHEDNGVYRVES